MFSPFFQNLIKIKLLITMKSSNISDKLSNFRANIESKIVSSVMIKIVELNPALKRTKNKDKYTNVEPVSF